MSNTLARLRMNLDFMQSPVPDRPGLLIRDPYQYSDRTLVIPPPLVQALQYFDGNSTDLDLRQALVRITGDLQVGDLEQHLVSALSEAGFLEDDTYEQMREARHTEFAESPVRLPAHAGSAYPDTAEELQDFIDEFLTGAEPPVLSRPVLGIASPHASPSGARDSYRDAYGALPRDYAERVFVILGTSHYGQPDRFGLTRKNFITPFGEAQTAADWVNDLAAKAPGAVAMEDYCHATEHSIEFQVAFLQYLYGPDVRILPILCGSYGLSLHKGQPPEANEEVRRFLGTLGEFHARHKNEIAWILGVDMAHIGRRYGDEFAASAYTGEMLDVTVRDKDRIESIVRGDAQGFWGLVQENQDDLKWCGSAPFYTFLKAVPEARSHLLRYQHWQIDEESVVSFAAMAMTG